MNLGRETFDFGRDPPRLILREQLGRRSAAGLFLEQLVRPIA
jgi:hypothetical protein